LEGTPSAKTNHTEAALTLMRTRGLCSLVPVCGAISWKWCHWTSTTQSTARNQPIGRSAETLRVWL